MAKRKQRVRQHIMEDESYEIIKKFIPNSWVIREFNRPDYGIDLVIELFEDINDKISETLGEFIFVQVKSMEKTEQIKEKLFPVDNVAKRRWKEDKSEYVEMELVKYSFDTDSIFTIQSLGASVSVLLFLVDLESKEVYFVCLNDYIDRIILPKNPNYTNQKTYTIKIPTLNKLSNKEISNSALSFYGKRAKLLASFSKFIYQQVELEYFKMSLGSNLEEDQEKQAEFIEQAQYFIEQIINLDIWSYSGWAILQHYKKEIDKLKDYFDSSDIDFSVAEFSIWKLWDGLTILGRNYEDLCKEWFLPKFVSSITSYPKYPEVFKNK